MFKKLFLKHSLDGYDLQTAFFVSRKQRDLLTIFIEHRALIIYSWRIHKPLPTNKQTNIHIRQKSSAMKWTTLAPQGWDTQQLVAGSCFGCGVILVGWLFYCSILIFSCFSFSHSSCFCKPHGSSVSSPQPSWRFLPSKRCSTTCIRRCSSRVHRSEDFDNSSPCRTGGVSVPWV